MNEQRATSTAAARGEDRPIVVETRDLTRVYGDGGQVRALDGVSFSVRAGEFVAIVGPSGSGKSTLLNLLGALDRPTSGEVIINGKALSKIRNLDRLRSRSVGFVFQMHNLIPTLTAAENVEVPLHETTWNPLARRRRAAELLEVVGLTPRRHYLPGQMSGGERQRVAIARALANRPALVLADEPTGNLDTQNTAEIMRLLREINVRQGATIIAVTHNHEVASATGRIITLRDGRIQSDVAVTSAFDRDLIDFMESPLGRAIAEGAALPPEFQRLGKAVREALRPL
jgi:ABC-type lipoprotein export system ATPase subunit